MCESVNFLKLIPNVAYKQDELKTYFILTLSDKKIKLYE
jgi:hypothetical protein